jgi:AcrR family transcriptional regulator
VPRAVDHEARRNELCDIVVDLAAREGFAAVTIRALAAASGSSTSSITHYFASRDELIALAVRREITRQQVRIGEARRGDGFEALRAIASAAVLGTTERERRLWMAIVIGSVHDPVLARELESFNAWWDALAAEIIGGMGLAPGVAAQVADLTDIVVAGVITTAFESPSHWSPERRERSLNALLDAIAQDAAGGRS